VTTWSVSAKQSQLEIAKLKEWQGVLKRMTEDKAAEAAVAAQVAAEAAAQRQQEMTGAGWRGILHKQSKLKLAISWAGHVQSGVAKKGCSVGCRGQWLPETVVPS
jgi:hypothetical protein